MQETTRQKIAKLFKPNDLQKLDNLGLTIVDKEDYRIISEGYEQLSVEVNSLKAQLAAERDKNQVRLFDEEAVG